MSLENLKQSVHLDDILEKIGAFGKHQVFTLILMGLAFMLNSMYCVNYIFAAEDTPYRLVSHNFY